MKASDLLVQCLETEGVEYIFGLPGEENADVMMSLRESSIRFILCRHEQTASFMADAYGRLTGKAGVCLGTLGPGATNLVTGVANGNMDRSPMVVITGQADTHRQHKESHQHMDVVDMFRPITKWAAGVDHPDNIPEMVRKAFKLAELEKPGACLIELPEDLAKASSEKLPVKPRPMRRPGADHKALAAAMDLIRSAKAPVILAGNGAIRKRASKQLGIFAQRSGLAVINTFMGKGAVCRDDPHCLFTMGLQSRDHVSCVMDEADLVIAVGYDLVEYHPRLWNHGNEKQVLHVDFLPAEVDENYRVAVELVGDIANSLWSLNDELGEGKPPLFDIGRHGHVRETILADLSEHKDDDTDGSIKPQKALWDCRQVLGPSDILLSDVGAHKMWIARQYHCDEPNTCLIPNGFCSMGFALPGAMAAKLIYPDRRVLAVCGDAGALMNIQDFETAVRYGINLVCLIWEDREYGLIAWKQQAQFGAHTDLSFSNPDFVKLAEAFGGWGRRVTGSRDLQPALEEAFDVGRPAIVTMDVDYSENMKLTERLGELTCTI
ncbi:MAG: acetolactate synthase large subunit [Phycisphaerales bacterium]|nr:acetolactate synthase large subunit [Phycisphaerales bacterium]